MIDSPDSLLPFKKGKEGEDVGSQGLKILRVGFEKESMEELLRLLETLDVDATNEMLVPLRQINARTYLGSGKVEEIHQIAQGLGCDAVVIDADLTPKQMRNMELDMGMPILDRPGVILEIFSRHARTKEAKVQVEIARLQYVLPRLVKFWSHFERQRGGGVGNRGMGEKQIEIDRRLVKRRMGMLQDRLTEIIKERKVQRAGRTDVLKVAIVGYTNAGKSTLLNALTHSDVLAQDKLFATLDSTVRQLDPDSKPPIVAIDTVGFIRNIPTSLIASFRSTLEELHEADLLLHVVDASSTMAKEQWDTTEAVLKELGLDEKPKINVLNKCDRLKTPAETLSAKVLLPGAERVSAMDKGDMDRLREKVLDFFRVRHVVYEILVPYSEGGKLESTLHRLGKIEKQAHLEKGTFFRVRIDAGIAKKIGLLSYATAGQTTDDL